MKFTIKTLLILILSLVAGIYYPFWSLVIISFFIGLIIKTGGWTSFLSGFTAIFLLWVALATIISLQTNAILTDKVAVIFSVSGPVLILITGFIGGLAGGMGAASGSLLAGLFSRKRRSKYY